MSLYERINKKNIDIPDAFELHADALCDIKENSIDLYDLMITTFKFGYMQGHRVAAMKDYIDVDEFVKKWCALIGEADQTDDELALAFAKALNKIYQQGVKDGMRKAGAVNEAN